MHARAYNEDPAKVSNTALEQEQLWDNFCSVKTTLQPTTKDLESQWDLLALVRSKQRLSILIAVLLVRQHIIVHMTFHACLAMSYILVKLHCQKQICETRHDGCTPDQQCSWQYIMIPLLPCRQEVLCEQQSQRRSCSEGGRIPSACCFAVYAPFWTSEKT